MEANKNINGFFTLNSFKSLGGSSAAVWLSCGVLDSVFRFNPKWLALIFSIIISLVVSINQRKKKVSHYFIALLNGLLIFSTAAGFNTFNSADWSSAKSLVKDTTGKSSLIQTNIYESSIIPFDNPWFLPKVLVDENEMLIHQKERLMIERDSVIKLNNRITEEANLLPKNEKDYKNKLDSLNKLLNNSQEEINSLKKEIERLKKPPKQSNNENEVYKSKYLKLQSDYNALQSKYDKLLKNCKGLEDLKSSYSKLQIDYNKLKKEYDALKSNSNYETIYNQLQECNKKLRECLSRKDTIR